MFLLIAYLHVLLLSSYSEFGVFITFYLWSSEINWNILRIEKTVLCLEPYYTCTRQYLVCFLPHFKMKRLLFLLAFTQLVLCRRVAALKSPRTSSILQIIFYFWSFEINGNIMRMQTLVLCLEPLYTREYFFTQL